MFKTVSAFCITHTFTLAHPIHLTPFALCQAFPGSDYYGVSVALGVAPGRQSRVSSLVDVQGGLGAPFVSLRSLETTLLPGACSSQGYCFGSVIQRTKLSIIREVSDVSRCIGVDASTKWTLGFKQFSLHHATRALAGLQLSGFAISCLSGTCCFPLRHFAFR